MQGFSCAACSDVWCSAFARSVAAGHVLRTGLDIVSLARQFLPFMGLRADLFALRVRDAVVPIAEVGPPGNIRKPRGNDESLHVVVVRSFPRESFLFAHRVRRSEIGRSGDSVVPVPHVVFEIHPAMPIFRPVKGEQRVITDPVAILHPRIPSATEIAWAVIVTPVVVAR